MRPIVCRAVLLVAMLVGAAVGAAVGVVVWALPAQAHPTLLATLPEAGYGFADPPEVIGVVFDEPVTIHYMRLQGQARGSIDTTKPQVSNAGRQVTVRPRAPLPVGGYTVRWQVTAQDGDLVDGSFSFGVGQAAGSADEGTGDGLSTWTSGLTLVALLRWLLFAALALVAGGLAAERLVRGADRERVPEPERQAVKPWFLPSAVLGLAAAGGLLVHQVGGGALLAGVRSASLGELAGTGPARLLVVELVAFLLAVLGAVRSSRPALAVAAGAVVVAEGLRSHLQAEAGLLGSLLIAVHLLAAAMWVGALVHVVRTALRWRPVPGQVRRLLLRYARLAGWLYAAVVVAGTIAAILVLPAVASLWTTGYGAVLLIKLGVVSLASVAALLARRRLSGKPDRRTGLPAAARVEGVALAGVLAVSAMLTAVTPPADPRQGVAFPPPAYEPTVRLGALAGQVTVGVVASNGQVVLRLRVPESDPAAEQPYAVTGTLTPAGGRQAELALRPCGAGCFTTETEWSPGTSELDLSVRAPGFTGGRVRFDVPQPRAQSAREARAVLDRMLTTMRAVPRLVFTEAVTSDTSGPTPRPSRHRETGEALLDLQPYRTGTVNGLAILNQDRGITELGFALSAESTNVRIWVDDRGRIVREQLVTPNHLITRAYSYP